MREEQGALSVRSESLHTMWLCTARCLRQLSSEKLSHKLAIDLTSHLHASVTASVNALLPVDLLSYFTQVYRDLTG